MEIYKLLKSLKEEIDNLQQKVHSANTRARISREARLDTEEALRIVAGELSLYNNVSSKEIIQEALDAVRLDNG